MSAQCDDRTTNSVSATRVVGSQGQRPTKEIFMIESPSAHTVLKSPKISVRRVIPQDPTYTLNSEEWYICSKVQLAEAFISTARLPGTDLGVELRDSK